MCVISERWIYKVEYVGTSIDKKLNHALNLLQHLVAYRASILQLKARVKHKNRGTKMICNSVESK